MSDSDFGEGLIDSFRRFASHCDSVRTRHRGLVGFPRAALHTAVAEAVAFDGWRGAQDEVGSQAAQRAKDIIDIWDEVDSHWRYFGNYYNWNVTVADRLSGTSWIAFCLMCWPVYEQER
eukprot:SAG25_NODE_112_length_14924_cov_13.606476_9_plen_119_part_00